VEQWTDRAVKHIVIVSSFFIIITSLHFRIILRVSHGFHLPILQALYRAGLLSDVALIESFVHQVPASQDMLQAKEMPDLMGWDVV